MSKVIFTFILGLAAMSSVPNTTTWSADPAHTKVGFTVTHMLVSDVGGYFKNVTASVSCTKDDFTDAVAEFTAQTNSVFTDNEQRDGHLKSSDFFDAEKYSTISFKSISFKKASGNNYTISGDLTIHGVTKPVILTAIAKVSENPISKKTIAGFKITGEIKRTDFNLGATIPAVIVSNEVAIVANAELIKQ